MTLTAPNPALLVPPVRLGRLLRETRTANGETVEALARRSGLLADAAFLDAVEAGRAELDEPTVRWVTALYGVRAEQLVPQRARLVIDLEEGVVAAGELRLRIEEPSTRQVLVNYLALVYAMRNVTVGTPVPLRKADLGVLSEALRERPRAVEADLRRIMSGATPAVAEQSHRFRRRLVVPLAGILVAATSVGGLLLVRGDGATDPARPALVPPTTTIGDAVVVRREAPVTPPGAPVAVDIGEAAVLRR